MPNSRVRRRRSAAARGPFQWPSSRSARASPAHVPAKRRTQTASSDAVFESLRFWQRLKFLQRVVLDLPDALAGYAEGAADLFEGARRHAEQAEAQLDHLALALGQRGQRVLDVLASQ